MEIGSLVECIKQTAWNNSLEKFKISVQIPIVKKIYTIRGFYNNGNSIYLEEIINLPLPFVNIEPSFEIFCFREILPAMDILKEIEKEIKVLI
jgi:hypothetical protein